MQNIYIELENLHDRVEIIEYINKNQINTILDVGGSWNCWLGDRVTHMFDLHNPNSNLGMTINNKNITWFPGNINDYESWVQIFNYVKEHGKFDFCNCTHTLEDLAYPEAALKYMPRIAKAGFIAVPSKYWELDRRTLFRGGHHHRWIFDDDNGVLKMFPKINLIEYMIQYNQNESLIKDRGKTELRLLWQDTIEFNIVNNDYLGPTFEDVVNMYDSLILHNN
jgi:hypothetical protein